MTESTREQFAKEVHEGLSSSPKKLSSKWFYDKKGDGLFVQIMNMPEYYLTDCEMEIFSGKTEALSDALSVGFESFDLYELGAGDGSKTMHLLRYLQGRDFTYRPIDISINALENLEKRVQKELPGVDIKPLQGEYFEVLEKLSANRPKVILFMGSNIGNLLDEKANDFLKQVSKVMNSGDRLLLGVDLKKSKDIVLPAYNDHQGITAKFNLNLLDRMNAELGANFDVNDFDHTPEYDENEGIARSFITANKSVVIDIEATSRSYAFEKGEKVFMEVSRKYDDASLEKITDRTSLELVEKVFDSRRYFCDAIFRKQ